MRDTVASICSGYGPAYSRRKHAEGLPPTELWDDLAGKGYLGVNIPEEWGGGGLGMAGLAAVGEEIAAAGSSLLLIVVSPAIVGSILARHGTPDQNDRWLRGIAAGTTKVAFAITEPDAGTNSHNLSTSLERRGGPLRAARPEDLHLGRGARRRRAGGGPQPPTRRPARPAVALPRGRGRSRVHARADPDALRRAGSAVDAVLRRRGAGGGPAGGRQGRRARPRVRRPEPGADHGGHDRLRRRAAGPGQGLRVRQRARGVGRPDRHAPGVPIHWPRPRSSSSWPGS